MFTRGRLSKLPSNLLFYQGVITNIMPIIVELCKVASVCGCYEYVAKKCTDLRFIMICKVFLDSRLGG